MDQALVLASIVLGVAIAFELEHFSRVLRSDKVKWHWAQPLFALFVLLTIIAYWWGAVGWAENAEQEGRELSLGGFLPLMFMLVLLALMAAAAFPDRIEDEGLDLAEYYQDNRRYQWTLMALYFWTVHIGYTNHVIQTSETVGAALGALIGDTIYAFAIIAMIFIRRWWQVALGFAILSFAPLVWFTRTL